MTHSPPGPDPSPIVFIDSPSGLNDAITDLCNEKKVAFDLEADSMFHFKEKICLIQASAGTTSYIIDPLPIEDLSPLSQILSDPDIVKIFHGADYDIRSLYRDYGIAICNLFDTELASRFLGNAESGLNTVLKNRFNITLEKKYQKKDWSQRPLPGPMIAYAAKDVQYLTPLYDIQEKELAEKGRLAWVEEECRDLAMVRASAVNERPLFLKIKGAGHLDRRSLTVLEALLEFRLALAEQKDRPLFKVMGNASLTKIALAKPATMEQLIKTRALSDRQVNMYGHPILQQVRQALAIPEDKLLQYPFSRHRRVSNDVSERFKTLKTWRDKKAAALELDPGVLISNAVLKSVAEAHPKTLAEITALPALKNWQKQVLGNDIITALGVQGDSA
jgi:ribonuclease D